MITSPVRASSSLQKRPTRDDGPRFAAAVLLVAIVAYVQPGALDELLRWLAIVWTATRRGR